MFDDSFKRMAVELSEAKGSVSEAAPELGLDARRRVASPISIWQLSFANSHYLLCTSSRCQFFKA